MIAAEEERPGNAVPASESPGAWRTIVRVPVWCAVFLVRCYQAIIRPHLFGGCRFHPTCSEYCIESLQTHGLLRGGWLGVRRLTRCHPFSKGGFDPVPARRHASNAEVR